MKLWWRTLCYLALGIFLCHAPTAADQGLQFSIVPNSVVIGTFYNGDRVTVTGQLPEDCEAVLRIMGQSGDLKLKKKGKVGGLLWMNLDTVTLENVPSVFMLYTAREFNQLLGPNPELSQLKKLGWASLRENTRIIADSADHDALFKEFIKLKEMEGFYCTNQGLLNYGKTAASQKSFEVSVPIPARFPPGRYQVEVYAVRDGQIVTQAVQPFEVKMVGFPAMLSSFAFNRGALFGLFAVVVAIAAGLVIGVVFSGSKGGSH